MARKTLDFRLTYESKVNVNILKYKLYGCLKQITLTFLSRQYTI